MICSISSRTSPPAESRASTSSAVIPPKSAAHFSSRSRSSRYALLRGIFSHATTPSRSVPVPGFIPRSCSARCTLSCTATSSSRVEFGVFA